MSSNPFARTACYASNNISKTSVIGSFPLGNRTRSFLSNLQNNQWVITSFIPKTGLVCIDLFSTSGVITHFTVTLPIIFNN